MRQSITNGLLSFYTDPRERVRADHDGFGIIANGRTLMPFVVEDPKINRVLLVSDGGTVNFLSVGLIETLVDFDALRYSVFRGVDIGAEYCGLHSLILEGTNGTYYSSWMNLQPSCANQRAVISSAVSSLTVDGVDYTLTFADNVSAATGATNVVIDGANSFSFTGNTFTAQNSSVTVTRTVVGTCGKFTSRYAVSGGGLPGDSGVILIDQSSKAADGLSDIWRFDFADEGTFDGIPYQEGFSQSLYLKLTFAEPTAPAEDDYWVNGLGERFLNFANTQNEVNAVAIDLPDDLLGPLRSAAKASTITATRVITGNAYNVNDLRLQFSRQADSVYSTATMTWTREYLHADAFNDRRAIS